MRSIVPALAAALCSATALATTIVSQPPASCGGTFRSSQLWLDPTPADNNLDGDTVSWTDFTLASQTTINHIEWWGNGACEIGFRIEFWPQDPNTIAYQPLGVFYYGPYPTVTPTAVRQTLTPTVVAESCGLNHYTVDLASPVVLPANTTANPRWFIGIISRTSVAYATFNWAQGTGGSNQTFQFVRGGSAGGGNLYRRVGDGRALVIAGTPAAQPGACCTGTACSVVLQTACAGQFQGQSTACGTTANPTTCCPANFNAASGLTVQDIFDFLTAWFAGDTRADFDHSGALAVPDIFTFLTAWFTGC